MLIVVTGGMGAGKSSIIKAMRSLPDYQDDSVKFISVDAIVYDLYASMGEEADPGSPFFDTVNELKAKLTELFGTTLQKKISYAVFKDDEPDTLRLRYALEDVFSKAILERIASYQQTYETIILEFPTFFDKRLGKRDIGQDLVISVVADESIRIERAIERGDFQELIQKKLAAQVDDTVRKRGSDFVVCSDTTSPEDNALRIMHFIRKRKNPTYKHAVTAGSYDPLTLGHVWMIEKALLICDHLTILVANNPSKNHLFAMEVRKQMIEDTLKEFTDVIGPEKLARISVMELDHRMTTASMANWLNAKLSIRGIRNQTDFTYENDLALVNRSIDESVETIYLIPPREYTEVSSSLVRNLLGLYDWEMLVNRYVSNCVLTVLRNKQQNLLSKTQSGA